MLKLKTNDFKILTRSFTPGSPVSSSDELVEIAVALVNRVETDPRTTFRLIGVGLSKFFDLETPLQPTLFDE